MKVSARAAVWWLAAPLLLTTLLLVLGPLLVTVGMALTHYDALGAARFAGADNLVQLWNDGLFWKSVWNSTIVAAWSVPMRLAIALALALLLMPRIVGASTARTVIYLPTVVPDIAYALLWLWILNPIYGPLGLALRAAGFPAEEWLMSAWGARGAIVLLSLFQIGEVYVVLLAARRELPGELYELCAVEGASPWYTFRRVTLPLLMPAILFLAARDVAISLQTSFVPALVITKGGPNFATLFLPLYVYQNAFEYLRFGYAAALSLAMFGLTGAMVAAQWWILRRWWR